MISMEDEREELVNFMYGHSIRSENVRKAFLSVSRENFVAEGMKKHAYRDEALPLERGQTISQPSTIAVMLELLEAGNGMKVLEVGSGSGYVVALLSRLTGRNGTIYGVELVKELAEQSKKNLRKEGVKNAEISVGDGSKGWEEKAPFDRVLFSCACPFIPKRVFDQLGENGRAVAPVGDPYYQRMEVLKKVKGKHVKEYYEGSLFMFVPLKGEHGFR